MMWGNGLVVVVVVVVMMVDKKFTVDKKI